MKRWEFIVIVAGVAAMSSSWGYSQSPNPQEIIKRIYVPVCGDLSKYDRPMPPIAERLLVATNMHIHHHTKEERK